jgi:hypothetical protein
MLFQASTIDLPFVCVSALDLCAVAVAIVLTVKATNIPVLILFMSVP